MVPKKARAVELNDFHPISLPGSPYKILAKVLANWLKAVVPSLISPNQSAFLEGRHILDSVVVAHESLHSKFILGEAKLYVNWIFEKHMTGWIGLSLSL